MVFKITNVRIEPFSSAKNVIHPTEPYSLLHIDRIMKNYDLLKETFIITIYDDRSKIDYPERASALRITAQWYTAVDCLGASLYAGSIVFATAAVEAALSHDLRLEKIRNNKFNNGWINLNLPNLRAAAKMQLPVDALLNDNETLMEGKIVFIERRNKAAHGDYFGYSNIKDNIMEKVLIGEDEFMEVPAREPIDLQAIDQINKSRNFLIEWAKQKPDLRMPLSGRESL